MTELHPAPTLAYRDPFEDGPTRRSTAKWAGFGATCGFVVSLAIAVAACAASLSVVSAKSPIWPIGVTLNIVGIAGLIALAFVWPRRGRRPFLAGALVAGPVVLVCAGLAFYA